MAAVAPGADGLLGSTRPQGAAARGPGRPQPGPGPRPPRPTRLRLARASSGAACTAGRQRRSPAPGPRPTASAVHALRLRPPRPWQRPGGSGLRGRGGAAAACRPWAQARAGHSPEAGVSGDPRLRLLSHGLVALQPCHSQPCPRSPRPTVLRTAVPAKTPRPVPGPEPSRQPSSRGGLEAGGPGREDTTCP